MKRDTERGFRVERDCFLIYESSLSRFLLLEFA